MSIVNSYPTFINVLTNRKYVIGHTVEFTIDNQKKPIAIPCNTLHHRYSSLLGRYNDGFKELQMRSFRD